MLENLSFADFKWWLEYYDEYFESYSHTDLTYMWDEYLELDYGSEYFDRYR